MVVAQTAKILQNERPRAGARLQAVRESPDDEAEEMPEINMFDDVQEYIAAVNKWNDKFGGRRQGQRGQRQQQPRRESVPPGEDRRRASSVSQLWQGT